LTYPLRNDIYEIVKRGFTLIELVVAVGILAMMLALGGVVFNVSIDTYRTTKANSEIIQTVRAVTDQLAADFRNLQKDGYLFLRTKFYTFTPNDREKPPEYFQKSQAYFFSIGDFQSWFSNHASNIARIYFGHDTQSWFSTDMAAVSKWRIVHDIKLLDPNQLAPPIADCAIISYSECKNDLTRLEDWPNLLANSVAVDARPGYALNLQSLMAQNIGSVNIQWTDGTLYIDPNGYSTLLWFGADLWGAALSRMAGASGIVQGIVEYAAIESISEPVVHTLPAGTMREQIYQILWSPNTIYEHQTVKWPKALKFTLRVCDSRGIAKTFIEYPALRTGIIREGRTFSHIIYLEK